MPKEARPFQERFAGAFGHSWNFGRSFIFIAMLLMHKAIKLGDGSRYPFRPCSGVGGLEVVEPGSCSRARSGTGPFVVLKYDARNHPAHLLVPPGSSLQTWLLDSTEMHRGQYSLPWLEGGAVGGFTLAILDVRLRE